MEDLFTFGSQTIDDLIVAFGDENLFYSKQGFQGEELPKEKPYQPETLNNNTSELFMDIENFVQTNQDAMNHITYLTTVNVNKTLSCIQEASSLIKTKQSVIEYPKEKSKYTKKNILGSCKPTLQNNLYDIMNETLFPKKHINQRYLMNRDQNKINKKLPIMKTLVKMNLFSEELLRKSERFTIIQPLPIQKVFTSEELNIIESLS
jgi:hypothetical protein